MKQNFLFNDLDFPQLFSDLSEMYKDELSDTEISNMVYDTLMDDWDKLERAFAICRQTDFHGILVYGDAQTWNGKNKCSDIYDDFEAFAERVAISSTQYEWSVYIDEYNRLHIDLYHHDGCHKFIAKGLTNAGYDLYMDYGSNPRYVKYNDKMMIELIEKSPKYSRHIGKDVLAKLVELD